MQQRAVFVHVVLCVDRIVPRANFPSDFHSDWMMQTEESSNAPKRLSEPLAIRHGLNVRNGLRRDCCPSSPMTESSPPTDVPFNGPSELRQNRRKNTRLRRREKTMRFFAILLALKTLFNLIVWLPIPLIPQPVEPISEYNPKGTVNRFVFL